MICSLLFLNLLRLCFKFCVNCVACSFRNMSSKADIVRKYVSIDTIEKKWQCNQCKTEHQGKSKLYSYTGGTSNIVRHFEENHKILFKTAFINSAKNKSKPRSQNINFPQVNRALIALNVIINIIIILNI